MLSSLLMIVAFGKVQAESTSKCATSRRARGCTQRPIRWHRDGLREPPPAGPPAEAEEAQREVRRAPRRGHGDVHAVRPVVLERERPRTVGRVEARPEGESRLLLEDTVEALQGPHFRRIGRGGRVGRAEERPGEELVHVPPARPVVGDRPRGFPAPSTEPAAAAVSSSASPPSVRSD